jgi:hypothetical protein
MRAEQGSENIREAFKQAAASVTDKDRVYCALTKADMLLLAGHSNEALSLFFRIFTKSLSLRAFGKLGRGLIVALLGGRWARFFFS